MSALQRYAAEALGTAFLLAAVVGSGIMGERLAGGNIAVALLANALATGAALYAIIVVLAPLSGAHLNPAVSLALALRGELPWPRLPGYVLAQLGGAIGGVVAAQLMFELPAVAASSQARAGMGLWLGEAVATLGLLAVVLRVGRQRPDAVPQAVAAYIVAAYWFTSSTAFANPAVTVARSLTDSFAGIRPADVPAFVLVQLLVVPLAVRLCREPARAAPTPAEIPFDSPKRTV